MFYWKYIVFIFRVGIVFLLFLSTNGISIAKMEKHVAVPGRVDTKKVIQQNRSPHNRWDTKELLCAKTHSLRHEERALDPMTMRAAPPDSNNWIVRFAHTVHNKVECSICHEKTPGQSSGPVQVEACFDCHHEAIDTGRCRDCHEKDRFLPTNHKPAGKWRKRHGYRANVMVFPDRQSWNRVKTGHAYDCAGCHVDDQCRKCHQLNRPDSHSGFWRIRGHGIRALAERDSCSVCHTETFCVRCHKSTKPINHVGNWNMLHGRAVTQATAERCWVCHPRVITRVRVGNTPECNYCHPQ